MLPRTHEAGRRTNAMPRSNAMKAHEANACAASALPSTSSKSTLHGVQCRRSDGQMVPFRWYLGGMYNVCAGECGDDRRSRLYEAETWWRQFDGSRAHGIFRSAWEEMAAW